MSTQQDKIICRFENDYYDLTEFAQRHPGGPTAITALAGKNATLLIENHHRNDAKVWKYLKACKLDTSSIDTKIPELNAKDRSLLELQRKWDKKGKLSNLQVAILLGLPASLWILGAYLFSNMSGALRLLGMFLHAVGLLLTIVVSHELSHFQVFQDNQANRNWNRWMGILFLGIDGQVLLHDHPVHHAFANIVGLDTGIENGPIVWHPDLIPDFGPLRVMYESVNRAALILLLSPLHIFRVFLKPIVAHYVLLYLPESTRGIFGVAETLETYARFIPAWISPAVLLRTAVMCLFFGPSFFCQTMAAASFGLLVFTVFSAHYDQEIFTPDQLDDMSFVEQVINTTEDFPVPTAIAFLVFGNQDQHCRHHLVPNVHRWKYAELEEDLAQLMKQHRVVIRERSVVDMWWQTWTFFASGEFRLGRTESSASKAAADAVASLAVAGKSHFAAQCG